MAAVIECPNCGAINVKTVKFCRSCGAPMGKKRSRAGKYLAVTFIFFAMAYIISIWPTGKIDSDSRVVDHAERIEAAKKVGEQRKQFFEENRQQILSDAGSLYAAGKHQELVDDLGKYRIAKDPDLNRLIKQSEEAISLANNQSREKVLLDELASMPDANAGAKLKRYEELKRMFPMNAEYHQQAGHYQAIVDERRRAAQAQQAREESIKRQFSAWDGSHRALSRYIKENMNDPGSYDHVETRYGVKGDTITVYTKFRGKNKFGALVVNEVLAETDINGTSLKITAWQ